MAVRMNRAGLVALARARANNPHPARGGIETFCLLNIFYRICRLLEQLVSQHYAKRMPDDFYAKSVSLLGDLAIAQWKQ